MQSQAIDLLINSRWMIPIVPRDRVLEQCAIAVDKGRIVGVIPRAEAASRYVAKTTLDLDEHVVLPGLVNAHTHAAMSLLRGYSDDLPLQQWLEDRIWPAENRWVDDAFVRDGTQLAMAEMIRSGTTCFSDMYFYAEVIAEEVLAAGMRAQVAFTILDFPTPWGKGPDEYIHKGLALRDAYRGMENLRIAFGPHAPYTVSNPVLEQISTYVNETDSPVHIHVHESASEVSQSLAAYGCRPLQRLNDLGLLLPQTQCVHVTQVNDDDLALLNESNSHVVHCPESNMKLANGLCPVAKLLSAGINVALGTDGAASNNDLDMFGEMKTAALLAKAVSGDPAALDAHTALRMATINGATALGWQDEIGSIEAGKAADLIAVRLDALEQQPLYHPASQLIYTKAGSRVTHSWVSGKPLLQDGQLVTLNEPALLGVARTWQHRMHPQD